MTEVESKYLKLQNGSDIRGVALPINPEEPVNLDFNVAIKIGAAFARWLKERRRTNAGDSSATLKVAVGRDSRLSGKGLVTALTLGLKIEDASVYDCGLASTPAMFMATQFDETKCDGAVMITASHLPANRNGFKFFTPGGGMEKEDIKEILKIAASLEGVTDSGADKTTGDITSGEPVDLIGIYAEHLKSIIIDGCKNHLPLSGLKIVVDAGNGSGGFYANKVLAPLGAEVIGCYLEPDGNFPNHAPNPENKEAMESISAEVKNQNADLGIIFDTDVDRSAAVDENGKEIARNGIVALAAALVSEKHPGTTVVTDSITSDELSAFLEGELGMKHLRFKRGYRNVINKAIELNAAGEESHLAIETSGHAAIKDNYFLDDGAYLATLIVIKTAQLKAKGLGISSMISGLAEPEEATEIRMKITGEDFGAVGDKVLADLKDWIDSEDGADRANQICLSLVTPNYEGVRANFSTNDENGHEVKGWFLLRKSLHDPIMPLNIESNKKGGCKIVAAALKDFLSKYTELDVSGL